MTMARLGVLFDQSTAAYRWRYGVDLYGIYIGEILSHRGIPFQWIGDAADVERIRPDLLIVALAEDDRETNERLWRYVEQGGRLISYGGLPGLASRLGYTPGEALGTGYAEPVAAYCECGGDVPWRFLQGSLWLPREASGYRQDTRGRTYRYTPTGPEVGPLLISAEVGRGRVERWTVDIPATIVRFQQGGGPVVTDGTPAPDGTADVRDGVLKADDVMEMDWELDRQLTETGVPYFAYPYADWWREQLTGHLLHTALEAGLTLPFKGYWPDGVSDVAMISHDSDGNEDVHAESTLKLLAAHDVRSTWCMLEPGYSKAIYDQVEAGGHELAFHYNAVHADDGFWDAGEFNRQFAWLKEALGPEDRKVTSNKNHLTRVEGWGELFEWCEACGIESDQTRGPSKKGNVGFLYGTCRPYYPIARHEDRNRSYTVLQLGFLTPDMEQGRWSDSSIIEPLLGRVKEVHGVAHILFHQVHLHRLEAVREAFAKTVHTARRLGFSFWTGREIVEWEKQRRLSAITELDAHGQVRWGEKCAPSGMVVWEPLGPKSAAEPDADTEVHYGLVCRKQVFA